MTRIIFFAILFLQLSTGAFADSTFDSIADSVEKAQAQAYVYLKKGVYDTKTADVTIKWTVPSETRATVRFRYDAGTIQDGLIDFGSTSTFAVLRSSSGLCTRFEIKKVIVLAGGAIAPESEIWMRPDASCKQKHSAFQNNIEQVFSLQPEARKLFRGRPFSSLQRFCKSGTPNCFGSAEPPSNTNPVSRITFFTSSDANGNPTNDAFSVGLKAKQRIEFPANAGYVRMGADSGVSIQYATYDTQLKTGTGTLKFLRLNVEEGQLLFGKTLLALGKGSVLSFDNVSIENDGITKITDGSFQGRLGDGSIVRLSADAGKESSITLQSAEAILNGLSIDVAGTKTTLTGSSGSLEIISKASKLHMADNALILLEGANLKLVLACPNGAPVNCRPFAWSGDGGTSVKGQLLPAQFTLSQGGYIGFPEQNKLNIAGGQLLTDSLLIDTDDKIAPITGKLQKLELRLEAQDWKFDKNTRLKVAQFKATSQNLEIIRGDSSPIGDATFEASVSDLEASGIGQFQFISGSSNMIFRVSRSPNDELRLVEGSLKASISARAGVESQARISLRLSDLQFYKGFGTGALDFSIDSMSATYRTPAESKGEGVPFGKFELSSRSVPLQFSLTAPVGLSALKLKVDNGTWSIPSVENIAVGIKLDVPGARVAEAQHYSGGGDIGGGNYFKTSCHPTIDALQRSYLISGKLDLKFGDTPRRLVSKDFAISEAIAFDVDGSDCKTVAFISCGIVGSVISGGNVIMGGAAALACGKKVDDAKKNLEEDLRDKSFEYIQKLNFDITAK